MNVVEEWAVVVVVVVVGVGVVYRPPSSQIEASSRCDVIRRRLAPPRRGRAPVATPTKKCMRAGPRSPRSLLG